jgi:hypothetical protein
MNSVYLCSSRKDTHNYTCKEFRNFIEASEYHLINNLVNNESPSSTMIEVPTYVPVFLKKMIIHYKLSNRIIHFKFE